MANTKIPVSLTDRISCIILLLGAESMLEREYAFYEDNKAEIREKYLDKRIVIVGDQVVATYDDLEEAYLETIKTYTPGTFMLHHVPVNADDEVGHIIHL